MSLAVGLWVRETALRLRAEGIELTKKAINSMATTEPFYTLEDTQEDEWTWEVGRDRKKESLTWLIK